MRVSPPLPTLMLDRARTCRRDQTPAERAFWRAVRSGQIAGLKVRRHVPIGMFIADLVVASARLPIEIDGESHGLDQGRDEQRTAWLDAQGWRVIRFTNAEVLSNLPGILSELVRVINPLPTGEGA